MRIVLFTNTAWNLYNFRRALAGALHNIGHEVIVMSPRDRYSEMMLAEGFNWKEFTFSRHGMNPFQETLTLVKLAFTYRSLKPDLVHHFTPKCILYGSLAAKTLGIPRVVNTVTGLGYLFAPKRAANPLIRVLVRIFYHSAVHNTRVIFQNPDDQLEFDRQKIIRKDRSFLIPGSGVDFDVFNPDAICRHQPPVVILPARLVQEKGVLEFVAAARLLNLEGVNVRFALVGDIDPGNPSSISRQQLDSWVKEGCVEWWGWQDDMSHIYPQVDLVCLPSYFREGVPKTLIEAAACGLPLIATDIPGSREVVKHEVNGLLIRPQNAHALASAVKGLLADPAKMAEMGSNGRKMAREIFSNEAIIRETLKIYELDVK